MIKDYFRFAKNRFLHIEEYPYIPQDYFDEFSSEESLYVHVKSFCDSRKYNYENFPENGIDAYSDLYLFKLLSNIP